VSVFIRRAGLVLALLALTGCWRAAPVPELEEPEASEPPLRQALLVGVTRYAPGLPWRPLKGPANDVELWRAVLKERFGFTDDGIVLLTEGATRPTRRAIHAEFRRLAEQARPSGQVFILLSGHGTQQPDQVPPDPDDPEPNGMDQVFLPADAGRPDLKTKTIPNGIIDDELRVWLRAITSKGARVTLVFDCCHAGTMLRDEEELGVRGVPAARLWPESVLKEAARNAIKTRGASTSAVKVGADKGVVALYACEADQRTCEAFFSDDESPSARKYGVFSHALCATLSRSSGPLTYRALVRRAREMYEGSPAARLRPTPFAEGDGLDSEFLGSSAAEPPLVLTKDTGGWSVNAGQLRGLYPGAVLAVDGGGKARITKSDVFTSRVEPVEGGWADGARATIATLSAAPQAVRLAVEAVPNRAALLKRLSALPLVRIVEGGPNAWHLKAKDGLELVGPGWPAPRFHYKPDGEGLEATLRQIARVNNLMWLAANTPGAGLGVEMKVVRLKDKEARRGPAVPPGAKLPQDAIIRVVVRNNGKKPVDVTVLTVDHDFKPRSFLPGPGSGPIRVKPGDETDTDAMAMELDEKAPTAELQRFVLIAVEAEGDEPRSFAWLAAPTFRRMKLPPLGHFLAGALFDEAPRSISAAGKYQLAAGAWAVVPKK
jgi:hypothetical protein